jgi:2-methylcitrate dehydratase PrpD
MFGLDSAENAGAISCAANSISGLLEPVGAASIERAIMAGNNCRAGVHAALLAKSGLAGTPSILEGPQGYFTAVGGRPKLSVEHLLTGLGDKHRIVETLYKKYPSAGANQSAVYAAEVAYRLHRPDPEAIRRIRVWQYPLFGRAVELPDGKPAYPAIISTGPYSNLEQVLPNKPFGVAAMILYGKYDFATIVQGLRDKRLLRLARKVTSDGNGEFGPLDAAIEIEMESGEIIKERVSCATESRFFPNIASAAERFDAMAGSFLTRKEIDDLVEAADGLVQPGGSLRLFEVLSGIGNLRRTLSAEHSARQ